ncbi:hypothetical protein A6A06_18140 [Streptomyces sp. CB02923]|uniref:hypothetical protein n=1 Tax=Streptomyces sp. CB02923 TaxID=1718985 RepID=UPI00093F91C6|nr:hypothetical protein [Streptomyces sp. CB02923]OKI00833.1 hypothetical protein A6A06_18140 [Streptomyces sp. CB02923]
MKNSLDSFSMVVPDVPAAAHLFGTVFGAQVLSAAPGRQGPDGLGEDVVDDHGAPAHSALLRLDAHTQLRLLAYEATAGTTFGATAVDIGTAHFCFRVGDIEQAARFIDRYPGTRILGDVQEIPEGPLRHHKWVYFRLPWGAYGELQEWAESPSAEALELFHGQVPPSSALVPTLMGLDHVGYSVRNLESAIDVLTHSLGGRYVLGSVITPDENFMRRQFETPVAARSKMAMVRVGDHTNLELFEHEVDAEREPGDRLAVGHSRLVFASDDVAGSAAELSRRFGFAEAGRGDATAAGRTALLTAGSGLDVEFIS